MIEKISTTNAPAAIGPYCQAMKVNGMVFTSGQLGLDPATGDFAGDDVTAQAEAALKNLGAILKEAGTDYDKIVKTTCFLADMADFAAFNAVYGKYPSYITQLITYILHKYSHSASIFHIKQTV